MATAISGSTQIYEPFNCEIMNSTGQEPSAVHDYQSALVESGDFSESEQSPPCNVEPEKEPAIEDIDMVDDIQINGDNFIEELRNKYNLKEGDTICIKNINGKVVDPDVNICDVFQDKDKGEIILMIERKCKPSPGDIDTDNDETEVLEVRFIYECTRDSYFKIFLHHFTCPSFKFKNIRFQNSTTCKIRSVNITGHFLACDNGRLTLAPIESADDSTHTFKEFRFTGFQKENGGEWRLVQLRTYQSISENKYISAKRSHDVRLKFKSGYKRNKIDSRFFRLIKCTDGFYYLESMVCPGTHLSWNQNRVELKIFCPQSMTVVEETNTTEEERVCI